MNMNVRRKAALLPVARLFVILVIAGSAVSCRSLPPVTPAERPGPAASPEELLPQWEPFAGNVTSALSFFEGKVREPRLELWALRVDLEAPGLRIVVSGPDPVKGEFREGYISGTTVSGFVRRYDCLAGINANPFSLISERTGEDRAIDGVAVAGGVVVSRPDTAFDALVFYEDQAGGVVRAAIVNQEEIISLEGIQDAVGGFWIVLQDGEITGRLRAPKTAPSRHPRSAAGLSADGRYLYLLVVDGRRFGSVGATEVELAELLRRLGASDGINFDGGGSTSLALRFSGGKVRPVNTPIHNHIRGWERKVAVCLGIGIGTGTENNAW
ncbi:MAG: phosphodiester glycosidase family protein [Treponema sp.]|nr:phosphodiester glycosidase family protein [Treponema sp.]